MKISINRETLLKPLQQVAGVVERRQTLPVLSNVLMRVKGNQLSMTGTDLEVEMQGNVEANIEDTGEITVPARKLMDIVRQLPDGSDVSFSLNEQRLQIVSGRFKSNLSTLPASDFPTVDTSEVESTVKVPGTAFKQLLDRTAFAMAQQDVRYFLNGMLIELSGDGVRVVATDGHRLATSVLSMDQGVSEVNQVIIPRKGILELQRMLSEEEGDVEISLGSNHMRAQASQMTLTTKLVDGKFPDYNRVIPKNGNKVISAEREVLRQALSRTAILSNEKFRGIRLNISDEQIQLSANNPEREEAEELVSVEYSGADLEIGFNVGYLLDALGVAEGKNVKVTLNDANSPALIESPDNEQTVYVVMPMKL
ncbi:MAG: DNA polymerase III subunit beta [Gammaproteobacteria bacterium]|nr:DNA polymerase III subunit beta [Gammaproteobacteria bacterium]RPG27314.1 MAG: DNA polymerase III subunit beta [Gammaproteobacteria bacterium TMED50]|tara:strand:- start:2831 stop:3931 length:1101 start_codon:yes stop_codon:yes gene_type:complete